MSNYNYKPLEELTIKDNFMFGAVMSDEENCRRLLEMILQFPIHKVEVSKEKSIVYHPEYKGVRLDVYAEDANRTHYNVEMQAIKESALGKRSRYYHSQLDMELLERGAEYTELPNTYVIFICDFDPFNGAKFCYTFKSMCCEFTESELEDARTTIFLSTKGKNEDEVPKSMVKFLQYVSAGLKESVQDFEDDFVSELQDSVRRIKASREMEGRYMGFQEMLKKQYNAGRAEGRAEGKAEAVLQLLEDWGTVPEELKKRIMEESDFEILKRWLSLAASVSSIEEFSANM